VHRQRTASVRDEVWEPTSGRLVGPGEGMFWSRGALLVDPARPRVGVFFDASNNLRIATKSGAVAVNMWTAGTLGVGATNDAVLYMGPENLMTSEIRKASGSPFCPFCYDSIRKRYRKSH